MAGEWHGMCELAFTRHEKLVFAVSIYSFLHITICFCLHNKYLRILQSDTENTASEKTDKLLTEAEKFIFVFWWRVYSHFGIRMKPAYAAQGIQAQYLARTRCQLLIAHKHQAQCLCTNLLCAQRSPDYAAPTLYAVHWYDQLWSSHHTAAYSPLPVSSPPVSG
jgi:hypothetical protein